MMFQVYGLIKGLGRSETVLLIKNPPSGLGWLWCLGVFSGSGQCAASSEDSTLT